MGIRGKQAWSMCIRGFPSGSVVNNLPADAGDVGSIPGSGRPLGEGNANHPSILSWGIPWTESYKQI